MAWTFNAVGSQTTLPSGPYLDIPNGDWSFTGWFRLPSNAGVEYRRLLGWGTRTATPHVQIYVAENNVALAADRNHLGARLIDPSGNDTGVLKVTGLNLSDNLNKWLAWTFTHNSSVNTTYLRIFDPSVGTWTATSVQALDGIDNTDITEPIYIGALNDGLDSRRFDGDMAEISFTPGLFLDFNTIWKSFTHGSRGFRPPNVAWNVPMLGDRTEVWGTGNSIITPTSTNVATTVYDGPPLQLITPQPKHTPYVSSDPLAQSVNNTLSFTQNADSQQIFLRPASSTLNFMQMGMCCIDIPVLASNTLTLSGTAGRTMEFSGSHVLVLASVVLHLNIVNDRVPCGSTLNLVQYAQVADHRHPEHDLSLIQTVDIQFPIKPNVHQLLGITQHTSTPHRQFVTQNLGITQELNTPLAPQHVSHTLNFIQDAPIGRTESMLNFVQSVQFSKSLTARNTMNLTHTMSRIMIYNRTITHDNVVGHALTWYEDSPCGRKQYTPFQGENTIPLDVSPPKDTLGDPQGEDSTFKLYQPYLGVHTSEVELRQPELDNRDRNAFSRVSQETRGGKLLVFADPIWPKVRTMAVTIVGLTEAQVDEFQSFMLETVGQEIGLTDWEGRIWKGFITNPNDQATQDGKARWTITFEFEGEILDVQQPGEEGDGNGMALNLTHSVTAVIV